MWNLCKYKPVRGLKSKPFLLWKNENQVSKLVIAVLRFIPVALGTSPICTTYVEVFTQHQPPSEASESLTLTELFKLGQFDSAKYFKQGQLLKEKACGRLRTLTSHVRLCVYDAWIISVGTKWETLGLSVIIFFQWPWKSKNSFRFNFLRNSYGTSKLNKLVALHVGHTVSSCLSVHFSTKNEEYVL